MECGDNSISCSNKVGVLDQKAQNYCLGPSLKGWFQAISFLLFMAGSFGNLTVITVILKSFQDLSSTDLFLVGLAGFDFLASIFLPLFYFLELSDVMASPPTDAACGFMGLMHEVSINVSVFLLLFAVYSFYRRIVCKKTDHHRKIRFFGSTVVAFVLAAVPSYPFHTQGGMCHLNMKGYTSFVLYSVVLFIIEVILPLFLFTVMFVRMGIELYHGNELPQPHMEADVSLSETATNQKKCKFLLAITSAFYIFFIPYIFMELWLIMDSGSSIVSDYECVLFDSFLLVICCKCFASPVAYFFLYEGFRENTKRIFCGWRIGSRYKFLHFRYRRDQEDGLVEPESQTDDGAGMNELKEWEPEEDVGASQTKLDDRDHEYDEEDEEDNVAILRPWKNLKSTSSF